MSEYHVPKGVSPETLREIVAGWAAVGAAVEPRYTAAVEEFTDISDAVGRQTRFLEDIGILKRAGQQHELTDEGQALAGALVAEDQSLAAERAREILADWELTEKLRGVLRQNSMDRGDLVAIVASFADVDPSASRVRSGITTLLDFFEWAGVLVRDDDERYRLPEDASGEERDGGSDEADTEHQDDGDIDRPVGPDQATATHGSARLPVLNDWPAPDRPADSEQRLKLGHKDGVTDGVGISIPTVLLAGEPSDSTQTIEFASLSDGSSDAEIALGEVARAVSAAIRMETTSSDHHGESAASQVNRNVVTESTGDEGDENDRTTGHHIGGGSPADSDEQTQMDTEGGQQAESGSPAISLGVDVDADAEDLESIVAAIRRGLVERESG